MKRCPECRRDYYDDSLLYCLDDGTSLLEGPGSVDGPATAILNTSGTEGDIPTRTFEAPLAGETARLPGRTGDYAGETATRRNSAIAGVFGVLLVAVLGMGGFIYYSRGTSKQIR